MIPNNKTELTAIDGMTLKNDALGCILTLILTKRLPRLGLKIPMAVYLE
jgi:hypothetical protein